MSEQSPIIESEQVTQEGTDMAPVETIEVVTEEVDRDEVYSALDLQAQKLLGVSADAFMAALQQGEIAAADTPSSRRLISLARLLA